MALVRCLTIFAVLCFLCSTGCIKKGSSRGTSSEQEVVSQTPDEEIPTYIVNTGPDVVAEPPSPFFKHYSDTKDENSTSSTVPIASDDSSLFKQPSPFDRSGEKDSTDIDLERAVSNGVEYAVIKSLDPKPESMAPKPVDLPSSVRVVRISQ